MTYFHSQPPTSKTTVNESELKSKSRYIKLGYANSLLNKFGFENVNPISTPLDHNGFIKVPSARNMARYIISYAVNKLA